VCTIYPCSLLENCRDIDNNASSSIFLFAYSLLGEKPSIEQNIEQLRLDAYIWLSEDGEYPLADPPFLYFN
jgi:hypothetical protein